MRSSLFLTWAEMADDIITTFQKQQQGAFRRVVIIVAEFYVVELVERGYFGEEISEDLPVSPMRSQFILDPRWQPSIGCPVLWNL